MLRPLLLSLLLALPVLADSTSVTKPVESWAPGAIAAAATATYTFSAGTADVFGLSWLCGAAPTISMTFGYANGPDDTHAAATSQSSVTYVSNVNITSQDGLSDLKVPPCTSISVTATNNGASTITPTFRFFHQ